jgi:hypothetical protein
MKMQARPIDPRDTKWEVSPLSYRVYFWQRQGIARHRSDEFELDGVGDVGEVLRWANEHAEGRTFVVYAAITRGGEPGLVRLAGIDPTENSTSP